jgi:hypothetical protein
MAVLKMCKINICAMKKDRKKILELLQLKGCLEVHEEVKEDKVFEKVNTATQISLYERQVALTDNALEILEAYIPEEKSMLSSLEGKKVISSDDYYEIVNKRNEINGLVNDIIEQKKSIDEKESGKQKCLDEIQALQPWLELDVPMNFQGTKNTGFMVGAPFQTPEYLAEDMQFLKELNPHMVGIGPFIPHHDTPFADQPAGTLELTLFMLGLIRLMLPKVLLPATTALGTIHPKGRELGILAGANVVMPNLSPTEVRKDYLLYDNKICTGDESAQCRHCLERRMASVGYQVVTSRGDSLNI